MSADRGRWPGSSASQGRGSSSPFRGRVRGFHPHPSQSWRKKAAQPPSPPLGPVLTTLSGVDLAESLDLHESSAGITCWEDVGSYNWLNEVEPTILVPGKPPAWTPPVTTTKLKEDDGNYFRDPNAARYPAHPIEPAVQAILASQPDFSAASIDVFACSSTLGNLLRFVRKVDKHFRMLVEVIGDTVFFVRRENSPTELIPDVKGFGHAFPDAYTTWEADVKRSESHQRVMRYSFGGLDCLVRFEADGYHKEFVSEESEFKQAPEPSKSDDLDNMLASALKQSTIFAHSSKDDTSLTVIQGGQHIPQSAIFDLKTRSIRKKDQDILGEELPRLWVAQITNFILAYHVSGVFEEIQIRNIRHEIDQWERENEDTLRRFAVLLRKIVAFARGRKDRKIEVRRRAVDVLELREQDEAVGRTLSATVEARWVTENSRGLECSSEESPEPGFRDLSETPFDWDEEPEKDFTACSAEDCGYCGRCTY